MSRYQRVFSVFLFLSGFCLAQKPYFQQRVDYRMQVQLNDEKHTATAFEEITYVNNSPDALDFIYFHLWPNAYKDNSTALAKQLLWQGKNDFYFSKPEERGYIDSLNFQVNGKAVKWEYDKEHIDICKVILNEPLRASDSITITTPFYLKIPDAKFSRLGHTGQAYYMTQWYPKPAVYDNSGWHQMPYLDQGEFYSEYGSFDVKLTVPDNYVLCATGDRINAAEEESFLQKRMTETLRDIETYKNDKTAFLGASTPVSTKTFKTVQFRQSNVHDFAWFADKRFYVLKEDAALPHSKRQFTAWVYFTPANMGYWKDAVDYVKQSTIFYSYHNGDYPYNNVSAVDGSIMAGGGMEYPNITVIGGVSSASELDMVITHEVGHNWFYGILGSNERDHPFLDEGINSFYELRYIRAKYPERTAASFIGKDSSFKLLGLNKVPYWKYHELPFYAATRAAKDQAISLKSEEFTESNYGAMVYSKSALIFDYLLDYMGESVMDSAMRTYYATYKFKHPSPNDLFKTLNLFSGKDLKEFQNSLVYSTGRIDYKIKRIRRNKDGGYSLTLRNRTGTVVPFNIYSFDEQNKVFAVNWYDGFENKRTITLPASSSHHFKIDGNNRMPDMKRQNNSIRAKGVFKKSRPLRLSFLTRVEEPEKTTINYVPLIAGNFYNGLMLGMAFHNYGFYEKRFEYLLAPMYGFTTQTPVGFAEINFNMYPRTLMRHISVGARFKSFAYDYYDASYVNETMGSQFKDLTMTFYKIAPYIRMELKKRNPVSHTSQFITYSSTYLITDSLDTRSYQTIAPAGPFKKTSSSFVNQLNYDLVNKRLIDPFDLRLNLQHTASMAKISMTFNYKITVGKKHNVDIRLFAGAFLAGGAEERAYYAFRASGYNGWHDYLFEGNYAARNERVGFGFSQFMERDGALKVWTPLGQTGEWMSALNVKSPKIFKLPLKVFADVVACDGRALTKEKVLWDAGVNLVLWDEIIDVYVPLVYSSDIKRTLELNNVGFPNTIRFTFNIHKLALKSILQTSFF